MATSVTVLAQEERRDHNWNDEYWHHHHYGYWHDERGYWVYRDHKHEFIRVSPELVGIPIYILSSIGTPAASSFEVAMI